MPDCPHCASLRIPIGITLPADLERAIRAAKEAVSEGKLSVLENETGTVSMPFSELSPSFWDDVVHYVFACTSCGQRFLLEAETYHGSGGAWKPWSVAMAFISGPHNSKFVHSGSEFVRVDPPLESPATTLGAALEAYGRAFDVIVRPCTAPLPGQTEIKYFEIRKPDGEVEWIVDVHVIRESNEICPKQDLGFPLQPGDRLELGPLAC